LIGLSGQVCATATVAHATLDNANTSLHSHRAAANGWTIGTRRALIGHF
jgi:hypothetical protein